MPANLKSQETVNRADYTVGSSSTSRDGRSSRPQVPKISTFAEEEGAVHVSRVNVRYPSFGAVVESLDVDHEPLDLSPHMLHVDRDFFKAASAPEPSDAFPAYLKEDFASGDADESFVTSPAQMFLSAFTPPAAFHKSEAPDSAGVEIAGYTLGATIGFGGFSTIKKAHSSCGAVVAIKIVKRSDIDRQPNPEETRRLLDNESEIWSILKHEHIMPLFKAVRTIQADYFVTLYCPAGSLFDILKRDGHPALPQDDAGTMFRQIVRGLRYLHEVAKLVHGDLKLENVFVDEMGSCRIGDFGLSKHISQSPLDGECECNHDVRTMRRRNTAFAAASLSRTSIHLSLRRPGGPQHHRSSTSTASDAQNEPSPHPFHQFPAGSLPYASPEMLMPPSTPAAHGFCAMHSAHLAPNPAQDMWALGVLLYALLTGRLPFADSFEPRLQMKILRGAYDLPSGIGHGAESVLNGCLEQSVQERWTIDMVDDIAWGVGWGLAGNVSSPLSSSPVDNDQPGLQHFGDEYRRDRSRSRARPYPSYDHHHPHHYTNSITDAQSSALSMSSDSNSRSRSRSLRGSSRSRRSSERSSSKHSSVHLEDRPIPGIPGPNVQSRRGRRARKVVDGVALDAPLIAQTPSDSRSPSPNSGAPTTPPDAIPRPFGFVYDKADSDPSLQPRGRARSKAIRADNGTGTPLDVVEERESEPPVGRWSPSSVLDAQALSLDD